MGAWECPSSGSSASGCRAGARPWNSCRPCGSRRQHQLCRQTLSTDPLFQLDAHLTRDLTEHFWGAIDGAWYYGGKSSINGVAGEELNNVGIGLTLGYQINDNLNLTVGYKTTVNDNAPGTFA